MKENGIPTAAFATFSDPKEAKQFARQTQPCVVKADGLAAGKGVTLCFSLREAETAIDAIMLRKVFGAAGDKVII
ncbi:MAG: ATP-grasp domain-containing protein, partial [Proteobacteria bacterium]|nr:ATP-grasp domain-containing protein [Pseudomonadota bacterium]